KGEHIALCLGNSVDWLVAFLAAMRVGAVVIPVSTRYTKSELQYCLTASDAAMLITEKTFRGNDFERYLKEIGGERYPTPKMPRLRSLFVLGGSAVGGLLNYNILEQHSEMGGGLMPLDTSE